MCLVVKIISDFGTANGRGYSLGVKAHCRDCAKIKSIEYRKKYPERIIASRKLFEKNNPGRALEISRKSQEKNREKRIKACREYYAKRKQKLGESFNDWLRARREKNLSKVKAREIVSYSIRIGKISRLPCVKCGDKKSEGHHHDYSKPLDVTWLCRKCHGLEHRIINHAKRLHKRPLSAIDST